MSSDLSTAVRSPQFKFELEICGSQVASSLMLTQAEHNACFPNASRQTEAQWFAKKKKKKREKKKNFFHDRYFTDPCVCTIMHVHNLY